MARFIKKYYSPDSNSQECWVVGQLDNKANEDGEVDLKGFWVESEEITPFDWGEDFLSEDEMKEIEEGTNLSGDLVEIDPSLFNQIAELSKEPVANASKAWKML